MYFFAVVLIHRLIIRFFFFFNDTATTEIYTLSLHDALPIYEALHFTGLSVEIIANMGAYLSNFAPEIDRKSTRLNSSHGYISYAVFCLKKKKNDKLCLTAAQRGWIISGGREIWSRPTLGTLD